MQLADSKLTLSSYMASEEVAKTKEYLLEHISEISTIEILSDDDVLSGALVLLLFSLKKSNPDIAIPLFENSESFGSWGPQQWSRHE